VLGRECSMRGTVSTARQCLYPLPPPFHKSWVGPTPCFCKCRFVLFRRACSGRLLPTPVSVSHPRRIVATFAYSDDAASMRCSVLTPAAKPSYDAALRQTSAVALDTDNTDNTDTTRGSPGTSLSYRAGFITLSGTFLLCVLPPRLVFSLKVRRNSALVRGLGRVGTV
jgi:hypothetical protein